MAIQIPAARLLSFENVSRLVKASSISTIRSNSAAKELFTRSTGLINVNSKATLESLNAKNSVSESFSKHQKRLGFLSSQACHQPHGSLQAALRPSASQYQSLRGFSQQRSAFWTGRSFKDSTLAKPYSQQGQRFYSSYSSPRRRPLRFIFKLMVVSSALVALPAVIFFGAPAASIFVLPIVVGGAVGSVFLLAGGILFFVIPIVTIGGALTFWFCAMPAAVTAGDLNKIIKRSKNKEASQPISGLGALGSKWEIQKAKSNEWFHWTFPKNDQESDKISIRMAIFDPNDNSDRKQSTLRWMNSFSSEDKGNKVPEKGKIEFTNNSERFSINNVIIKREDDHVLINIEDDGAKLLSNKWGRAYLELAKIVDHAATEMESKSGSNLGNQVVLVRKVNHDSFWNKFSLFGDISPRIPFDRTWIHDVFDE